MQSIKSKLFIWALRNRHLFAGKFRPEVIDQTFNVGAFRDSVDRSSEKMKLPQGVTRQDVSINGMHAQWMVPADPAKDRVLLYIHGGGFISGSCLTHRVHVAKFARASGMRSLLFDYRLAPEHPFPAAPEDCVAAYQWLLDQGYEAGNIVVGGESAGATLTLSLLLALNERDMTLPRSAFAISPVTDLRCEADSFTYNAKKDIAPMGSWSVWTGMYIAGNDPTHPLLSPLFGNYERIPPLYICVGTHEIHYDDCVNVALKAQGCGVKVILRQWDGMVHAFPMLSPLFPEAKLAFEEICAFVKQ